MNRFPLLLLLALAGCRTVSPDASEVLSTGRPVGEIRGTELVNQLIRIRMLDQSSASAAAFQIEQLAGPEIYSMRALLGQYTEGTAQAAFRGGEPNPFGLLLWHQVVTDFANAMGKACAGDGTQVAFPNAQPVTLGPTFTPKLKSVCAWPADPAGRADATGKLWKAVVGFAAPDEETAFTQLFANAGSPFDAAQPADRVAAMFQAMMLNPYFLLER